MSLTPRFPVGTRFMSHGKHPLPCTVIDIHTTTNAAGKVVKIRYVATHEFMGQVITCHDVCDTAIAMRIIKEDK